MSTPVYASCLCSLAAPLGPIFKARDCPVPYISPPLDMPPSKTKGKYRKPASRTRNGASSTVASAPQDVNEDTGAEQQTRDPASRARDGEGSTGASAPQEVNEDAGVEQQTPDDGEILDDGHAGDGTAAVTGIPGAVMISFISLTMVY